MNIPVWNVVLVLLAISHLTLTDLCTTSPGPRCQCLEKGPALFDPSVENVDGWEANWGSKAGYEVSVYGYVHNNIPALDVSLFLDSIGTNTHLDNTDNGWTYNKTVWLKLLQDAKIRHLRVGLTEADCCTNETMIELGNMGFKLTLLADAYALPSQHLARVKAVNKNFTSRGLEPIFVAVEGPNEPDNFWSADCCLHNGVPVTYKGEGYPNGAALFLEDLYRTFKNDSEASWITVVGIASGLQLPWNASQFANFSDWGNFHPYPFGGNSLSYPFCYANISYYNWRSGVPSCNLDQWPTVLNQSQAPYGNLPMMSTESGYMIQQPNAASLGAGSHTYYAAAKYIPRLYAEYFRLGIKRVLQYDFMDEDTNSSPSAFGLLDDHANPKPPYYAIKNLLNLLDDGTVGLPQYPQAAASQNLNPNGASTLFSTPHLFNYTLNMTKVIKANPGGLYNFTYYRMYLIHHLLLHRQSDQSLFLLIWHEIGVQDLNYENGGLLQEVVVTHPPIPTNITFYNVSASYSSTGYLNFSSKQYVTQLYSYNENDWSLQPSPANVLTSNVIQIPVVDSISVLQIKPTTTIASSTGDHVSSANSGPSPWIFSSCFVLYLVIF